MRFTADREALKSALAIASKIVATKSTIPILQCFRLEAKGDAITITATDLDQQIRATAKAHIEVEGETAVDAARFSGAILSLYDGADFTFELTDSPRATLKSGRARFLIPTLPAADFPLFHEAEAIAPTTLPAKAFADALEFGSFCASTDSVRTYLEQAYLHSAEDGFRIVSTNGHRLAWATMGAIDLAKGVCIPQKSLAAMNAVLAGVSGDVEARFGSKMFGLDTLTASYRTKLGEGDYVDYGRVVPKTFRNEIVADIDLLNGLIGRALVMVDGHARRINIEVSESHMAVSSRNESGGQADDQIEVDYSGPDWRATFNVDYWRDILARIETESVSIRINDSGPVSVREVGREGRNYILMPMSS